MFCDTLPVVDGSIWLRFDLDLRESLGQRLQPDAVILQEDRNLVMAPPGVLDLDRNDDLVGAYLAILRHRPLPLGQYLLLPGHARQARWTYHAVVHDLERRPSARPGSVRKSLEAVIADAPRRGLQHIAAEPLGVWGSRGLSLEEMLEAFDESVLEASLTIDAPLRLTLMLGDLEQLEEASHLLRSQVLRRASRSFRTVGGDAAVVEVRRPGARLHFRFVPGSLSGYKVTRLAPTVGA